MTAHPRVTYPQLLETNALIQQLSDESYWLCLTRTVQESKLFPVSAYMLLSYFMAFYRYPELVRKVDRHLPAEHIGDRHHRQRVADVVLAGDLKRDWRLEISDWSFRTFHVPISNR